MIRIEVLTQQTEKIAEYGVNYTDDEVRALASAMERASNTLWREILTRRDAEREASPEAFNCSTVNLGLLANIGKPDLGGAA